MTSWPVGGRCALEKLDVVCVCESVCESVKGCRDESGITLYAWSSVYVGTVAYQWLTQVRRNPGRERVEVMLLPCWGVIYAFACCPLLNGSMYMGR